MGTMQLSLALAGEKIVIAGLALQVATFAVFLVAAADFHARIRRASKTSPASSGEVWRKMLRILYTLSTLILLRCVFRLIEYAMGNEAYLIAHEWTLYVFDGVPMAAVMVLMLVLKPSEVDSGQKSQQSGSSDSSDGEMGIVSNH